MVICADPAELCGFVLLIITVLHYLRAAVVATALVEVPFGAFPCFSTVFSSVSSSRVIP